jgi:flagellar motor switch protein FliG
VPESHQPAQRLSTFEDLQSVSDELLRHLASRVHVSELAYAFGRSDPALRDRLLAVVRPRLASDIRGLIQAIDAESARIPPDIASRSAQARVLDLARSVLAQQDDLAAGQEGAASPVANGRSAGKSNGQATTKQTKGKGK